MSVLVPLEDIHLTPQLGYEAEQKGNRSAIIALVFAAVAILVIAWINYINLTVARSMERAKEVGVRGFDENRLGVHVQSVLR